MSNTSPPASTLSPTLLAALAVAATHIEPVKATNLPPSARVSVAHGSFHSKKVRRNRKRNKLAAQSRKRNRR